MNSVLEESRPLPGLLISIKVLMSSLFLIGAVQTSIHLHKKTAGGSRHTGLCCEDPPGTERAIHRCKSDN